MTLVYPSLQITVSDVVNCRMKLRLTTDSAQFKPSDGDDETTADLQHIAMTAMQGLDIEPDDNEVSVYCILMHGYFLVCLSQCHTFKLLSQYCGKIVIASALVTVPMQS